MSPRPPSRLRLSLLVLAGLPVLVVSCGACVTGLVSQPRPEGVASTDAEALADQMLAALDFEAWKRTGAVRWCLAKGRPLLLWDRARDLVELTYDGTPETRVLLDPSTRKGVALRGDALLPEAERAQWLEKAFADFANDSFWLAAPYKVRDPGTARALVDVDGERALLVSYSSGGVTPGDAYLWRLDESGRPKAWRMWVQILPVGGLEASWEEWVQLSTGAWLARSHAGPFGITLRLAPLEGAVRLADLVSEDPFAPHLEALGR